MEEQTLGSNFDFVTMTTRQLEENLAANRRTAVRNAVNEIWLRLVVFGLVTGFLSGVPIGILAYRMAM